MLGWKDELPLWSSLPRIEQFMVVWFEIKLSSKVWSGFILFLLFFFCLSSGEEKKKKLKRPYQWDICITVEHNSLVID